MIDKPLVDWSWIGAHLGLIGSLTVQHIWYTAIAVCVGLLISFGLAMLSVRSRPTYGPITAVTGVLYTIPSLALFAALVPLTGLSILTLEIPLITYTLLILVRNIVAGFDAVPPDVLEAAEGMGYTWPQRMRDIEIPLAVPLIVAGIRLATVSTIGLVTVGTLIGDQFGGLGLLIKEGIQTFFPTKSYVGAILAVGLAFLADAALVRLQRRLTPWSRAHAGRVSTERLTPEPPRATPR